MALFKRKLNKNAKNRPYAASDFFHSSMIQTTINGTAFACIDRISSEFASLNFAIYDKKTKQKVAKHPLYDVLKEPNLEERHYNYFYQSGIDYYNSGCYWFLVRIADEIVSMFRLDPKAVTKFRDENNRLRFQYKGKVYSSKEILYIPSRFNYSTLYGGKSIFEAVASVFDTANNLEAFTQNSFLNGVVGKRWMLNIEKAFPNATPQQIKDLKDSFQREYTGINNVGRPIIEIPGVTYGQMEGTTTDNRAAELIENRKYQEHEISKIFGIPEEMLSGMNANTNIENVFVMFNEFALRPMASQFQDAINSLLDETRYYFEFDYNGIMKVSLSSRVDSYVKQINNGLLSIDEARAKENLGPVEAGDTHFMPANMMPWTEEIKNAYMAKQKNEANQINNPTNENTQHIPQGDDKQ